MTSAVPKVELIFESTCPNVEPARELLDRAFRTSGLKSQWLEWDVNDPDAPEYVKGYGSPTILVNGKDVAGEQPSETSACCRIYKTSDGHDNKGVPMLAVVIKCLKSF